MTTNWLVNLLDKYSSKNYHIEYDGFLSNHVIHGIIALYRLSANEERIQSFIKFYSHKLRQPELIKEERSIEDLKGKRIAYKTLVDHYYEIYLDCNSDVKLFLEKTWPDLCDGMAGSAIHGLIHLGYALSEGYAQNIIDAVAYVHHSYVPVKCTEKLNNNPDMFGRGKENPLDIVKEIGETLTEKMYSKIEDEEILKLPKSYLQRRIAALHIFYPKEVLDFVKRIYVPESIKTCLDLAYYALRLSIIVYIKSARKNDFFLVHGVTSGWSVTKIVKVLGDCDLSRRTITVYVATLLCAYVGQLSPKLNNSGQVNDVDKEWWEDIRKEVLAREEDEHIYKLIQVCKEMWEERGWEECPVAARLALDNPLTFKD